MMAITTDATNGSSLWSHAHFIEGWMRGTYVVVGVFSIPCRTVSVQELKRNIPALHARTKQAKRAWWPRGLSGMFLFPFYLGSEFDAEVTAWVQRRWPYRWAIWHEPVLYDIIQNAVWMRGDYGLFGSAFFPMVFELHRRALTTIAERLGGTLPEFINALPPIDKSA